MAKGYVSRNSLIHSDPKMHASLKTLRAFSLLCVGSALVATTAGCGPLAEVTATKQFSKMQDQALDIFPKIGGDIYDSCMRQASYKFLNAPPRRTDDDRIVAIKICEIEGAQAMNAVNNTHALIIGYLASLGNLAKGETVDYKSQVNDISKSLKTIPGLDTDQRKKAVDAGTSIATFLAKAFATGYQKQQLKAAVISSDIPLQVLVRSLTKSVDEYYLNVILTTERNQLDNFYSKPIGLALVQPRTTSVDQYVIHNLNSSWQEKQAITRAKASLARAYLGLLGNISCEHSKLKDKFLHDAAKGAENANLFCKKEDKANSRTNSNLGSVSSQYSLLRYQQIMSMYSTDLDQLSRETRRLYSKY